MLAINLLLLLAAVFLTLSLLPPRGRVFSLLAGFLIGAGSIVIIVELASLLHLLSSLAITIGELIFLAGAGILWWRKGRPGLLARLRLNELPGEVRGFIVDWRKNWPYLLMALGVMFFLAVEGLASWRTFDVHFDTVTYHYPKIALWLQNRTISFLDPALREGINDARILNTPPVSDILYLTVFAGTGTLRGVQIVEWFSLFPAMLAIYGLGHWLTGQRKPALMAALIFTTMDIVLVDTRNGGAMISAAAFLLAGLYFLALADEKRDSVAVIFSCLGLSLAIATKPTVYFALPLLFVFLLAHLFRGIRSEGWPWLKLWLIAGGLSLAVFSLPFLVQNQLVLGYILPKSEGTTGVVLDSGIGVIADCLRFNLLRYLYWVFFPMALPEMWATTAQPVYREALVRLGEALQTPWTSDVCTRGGDFGTNILHTFTIMILPLFAGSVIVTIRDGLAKQRRKILLAWLLLLSFFVALSATVPVRTTHYRYLAIPAALISLTFISVFAVLKNRPFWLGLIALVSIYNMGWTSSEKIPAAQSWQGPEREKMPQIMNALIPEDAHILGAFNATGALDSMYYGDHLSREITLSSCADLPDDMSEILHDYLIISDVYPASTFESCLASSQAVRGDNALAERLSDDYALRYETWYTAFNHVSVYQRLELATEADLYPLSFPAGDERIFVDEHLEGFVGGGPVDYHLRGIGLPGDDYMFSLRSSKDDLPVRITVTFSGESCRSDGIVQVRVYNALSALILNEGYTLTTSDDDMNHITFDMVLDFGITRLLFDEGECDMEVEDLLTFEMMTVSEAD